MSRTAFIASRNLGRRKRFSCGKPCAEGARIGEIRERLENADRWRDHVMVVAHRGGGSAYAELSYEATAGIN